MDKNDIAVSVLFRWAIFCQNACQDDTNTKYVSVQYFVMCIQVVYSSSFLLLLLLRR